MNITLSTTSSFVTILDSVSTIGALGSLSTANNNTDPFLVKINPGIPINQEIIFRIRFVDANYLDYQGFDMIVNPDYINVEINDISTTITSKGRIGYNTSGPGEGLGFVYKSHALFYESGLMIGVADGRVSDDVRGQGKNDNDFSVVQSSVVSATQGTQEYFQNTQLSDNIGNLAREILASRRAWYMTKGLARPLMKYAVERTAEDQMRQHGGDLAASLFTFVSDIFNIASEQADVRSWQTLPNNIRIARLDLAPGSYDFFIEDLDQTKSPVEKRSLGRVSVQAAETRFLVTRGYK